MAVHYFSQSAIRQRACHALVWFILATGLSIMPTPASVFAVRHKELSLLIHSVLTNLKTNQHEWQQLCVPCECISRWHRHTQTHTPQARTDRLLLFTWVSVPIEALFVWIIPVHCVSFSFTCSYLPAAGERLSWLLAGCSSDTSTANCQTGFFWVEGGAMLIKPFCLLRESRPESVWLWNDSGFVML